LPCTASLDPWPPPTRSRTRGIAQQGGHGQGHPRIPHSFPLWDKSDLSTPDFSAPYGLRARLAMADDAQNMEVPRRRGDQVSVAMVQVPAMAPCPCPISSLVATKALFQPVDFSCSACPWGGGPRPWPRTPRARKINQKGGSQEGRKRQNGLISASGNRTPATSVKARDPNLWTNADRMVAKQSQSDHF
jgi:hypothetical protein